MVNAFFCKQDYSFQTEIIFEKNKAFYSFVFLWLYISWNKYFVEYMISHLRNRLESSKKWICTIKRENKPQKGAQTIQKVDIFRRLCPEGWLSEICFSWSISPSKLLQHDSRIRFKKSNVIWRDPKEALTSLKSWWTIKRLLFHFCDISKGWERKVISSLSSLSQWIKEAQGSRIAQFNGKIVEVY